jgi:hypothetical protein
VSMVNFSRAIGLEKSVEEGKSELISEMEMQSRVDFLVAGERNGNNSKVDRRSDARKGNG